MSNLFAGNHSIGSLSRRLAKVEDRLAALEKVENETGLGPDMSWGKSNPLDKPGKHRLYPGEEILPSEPSKLLFSEEREIVERLAESQPLVRITTLPADRLICAYCGNHAKHGEDLIHDSGCLWLNAKELMDDDV